MSTWLLLAILAQFLHAITVLIDKHIVVRSQHIGKPIVYAFYILLLSGFVVVLVPFGVVSIPAIPILITAFAQAASFLMAIFLLYSALLHARPSDVAPVVGGVSATATLIFAGVWIDNDITLALVPPIVLLASGTALISHFHFSRRAMQYTLGAGFFFGLAVFLAKIIFLQVSFFDGFFWPRFLSVFVALSLLLVPSLRRAILHGGRKSSRGSKALVLGNKIIGSTSGALTALAISLGSVSVVNALSGVQFVFLFLFAVLFAHRMPPFSEAKSGSHGGWHTAVGITLIAIGLAALYLMHPSV